MSAAVTIAYVNRWCAFVRGYRGKELLDELGRRPVWSSQSRAWGVLPRSADDLVALCQERGVPTEVVEVTHLEMTARAERDELLAAVAEDKGLLW